MESLASGRASPEPSQSPPEPEYWLMSMTCAAGAAVKGRERKGVKERGGVE
jgi:hypothetical protein